MCVTLSSCATIFIKSQLFILLLEQPSTGKKALRDMEDRKNTSFYREFEFKEEDNLVHSQMKMQETVVGEINFDDDSAKKVIMVVVEYAKTYPRFEENYKFISRELTILNRYY
ncbi:hypothetical protein AAZV13_09G078500 [Glycine max]